MRLRPVVFTTLGRAPHPPLSSAPSIHTLQSSPSVSPPQLLSPRRPPLLPHGPLLLIPLAPFALCLRLLLVLVLLLLPTLMHLLSLLLKPLPLPPIHVLPSVGARQLPVEDARVRAVRHAHCAGARAP